MSNDADPWTGLDANMHCEIYAEVFRIMTGHMAPFKSASPMSQPAPQEERSAAYDAWFVKYGAAVRHTMHAFKELRPSYPEEA